MAMMMMMMMMPEDVNIHGNTVQRKMLFRSAKRNVEHIDKRLMNMDGGVGCGG